MDLFDIEAEKKILGAVLQDPINVEVLLDDISIECFYEDHNKILYSAMVQLYIADEGIDTVTLVNKVKSLGHAIDADYINDISESIINLKNFKKYVTIIYDLYLKRELMLQCDNIRDNIHASNVHDLVFNMQEHMLKALDIDRKSEITNMKDTVEECVGNLGDLEVDTIKTGFKDVDHLIGGLNGGDIAVLAARPSMGKTSLAINFLVNMTEHKRKCLMFSLEQPKKQICLRTVSLLAGVELSRIKEGRLHKYERIKIDQAKRWFLFNDIYIDDTNAITIPKMRAKIRKHALKEKTDVVLVDYLQLMRGDTNVSRNECIGRIMQDLKSIAKEFNLVVIVLSQLSRDIEKRGPHATPRLADLRDSGEIEQVADLVFFIDRDFYDPLSSKCDFIVGKHREGAIGTIKLMYKKDCFSFFDVYRNNQN